MAELLGISLGAIQLITVRDDDLPPSHQGRYGITTRRRPTRRGAGRLPMASTGYHTKVPTEED
jgi:hypothetical protein